MRPSKRVMSLLEGTAGPNDDGVHQARLGIARFHSLALTKQLSPIRDDVNTRRFCRSGDT
jgi:hypothetical protein